MPFHIIRQDITLCNVDAIVNAANTALQMGGGVCGAIFAAAGAEKMQAACDRLAPIAVGEAVVTDAFDLPCRVVIHAAGPVYRESSPAESARLLAAAYTASLHLAVTHHCESIAFPLISSGIYGYPKDEALQVATAAIRDFLEQTELDVYLVVFDDAAFAESAKLVSSVADYLKKHLTEEKLPSRTLLSVERRALQNLPTAASFKHERNSAAKPLLDVDCCMESVGALDALVEHLDEPFNSTLLRLIDAKGLTDVAVYKRANLDRKLFSKIRTGKGYCPSKRTALALAVALQLSLAETDDLLSRAGYALSHSQKFDVIVEYFIINGIYDLYQINEVLFQYDQPLLGGG